MGQGHSDGLGATAKWRIAFKKRNRVTIELMGYGNKKVVRDTLEVRATL